MSLSRGVGGHISGDFACKVGLLMAWLAPWCFSLVSVNQGVSYEADGAVFPGSHYSFQSHSFPSILAATM